MWYNIGSGKTFGYFCGNITVGEVDIISLSDVEEAWVWKLCECANFVGHIFWDVAEMVAVIGEYLNGVWIIGVCWFCFQNSNRFTKIFINVVTIFNACYTKSYHIKMVVVLWPYRNIVAFVLDAEIFEFLDGCIRIAATNCYLYLGFFNRFTIVVKEVEVGSLNV